LKRRGDGFTLVEILVTTAMFSLLVAAAMSVFSAGSRSAAKAKRYREMVSSGQAAIEAMTTDIRAAVPYRPGNPSDSDAQPQGAAQPAQAGAQPGQPGAQAGTTSSQPETRISSLDVQTGGRDCDTLDLVIARPNPDYASPDEGGRASVGYYLNIDPSLGPVGLLRRENRSPGSDPLSGGQTALIAPFVSELNLEFYDGTDWLDGWTGDSGFPKAVRIKVVVLDEAGLENPLTLTTTVPVMAQ
jgi:prepilin-type N-terminal cleavage/methylation domain-containing protein